MELERVRNILPELRKNFALHPYVERTDKGAKFDNWWGGYTRMHFFTPFLEVLTKLLPQPAGVPEPGITMPLQQISPSPSLSTTRKGKSQTFAVVHHLNFLMFGLIILLPPGLESIAEDAPIDPTPQKPKRTKMIAQR